tara:strand:+ start:1104 stop:1358 length:255 start_codon:yes stop_codon:yes gene_type:complete
MSRIPLDVKVGDRVTSTQLKKHGLVRDTPLHKGSKTWTVVEINEGTTTMSGFSGKKKKAPREMKITRIVLQARNGVKTRTFWYN